MAAQLYIQFSYSTSASRDSAQKNGIPGSVSRLPALIASRNWLNGAHYTSFGISGGAYKKRQVLRRFQNQNMKLSDSPAQTSSGSDDRPPFDINLAVVLAGFAFEAYNAPPDNSKNQEEDPFGCKTIILSEKFLREVYDGQMFINLKSGAKLPGLDLWGTSDPYVVLRIGENVVRSKTVWAKTEPVWNEQFEINVKDPSEKYLQVAAWDANLVTSDRRLGNSGVNLGPLSDGNKHEVTLDLEGIGGGGSITLEIQYKSFEDIDSARRGWRIPLLSDFLQGQRFDDVFSSAVGRDGLTVQDFLSYVLGSPPKKGNESSEEANKLTTSETNGNPSADVLESSNDAVNSSSDAVNTIQNSVNGNISEEKLSEVQEVRSVDSDSEIREKGPEVDILRILAESIGQRVGIDVDKLKLPALGSVNWDALDVIKKLGLESRDKAVTEYVESGLALPLTEVESSETDHASSDESSSVEKSLSLEDIKKASMSLLKQTDQALKSWTVLAASLTESSNNQTNTNTAIITSAAKDEPSIPSKAPNQKITAEELEEMRKMFGKTESAMEAWAVLATSLGHNSFVKSAFEKLCFLDNSKTDTQLAIWRDAYQCRLVISFRGTEQVKWKDLRTDLMILPVSFNPERVGGEFKEEAMVHGGFLSAYDSVRNRLMTLIKVAVGASDEECDLKKQWQVFVTGHSLGGALATLLALELSTSKLARRGHIKVTMYNFGSPRVGNKKFAERYNEIIKDSWRVVNHRDIIPTVPRLMGYCHVAQPIYLTAGDVSDATVNMELIGDGYQGDVIGEATPDFLLEEFMKGEKRLIEKLLQTEIAMLRSIRDGTALMQHMEDFYYISLLESVSPQFRPSGTAKLKDTIENI